MALLDFLNRPIGGTIEDRSQMLGEAGDASGEIIQRPRYDKGLGAMTMGDLIGLAGMFSDSKLTRNTTGLIGKEFGHFGQQPQQNQSVFRLPQAQTQQQQKDDSIGSMDTLLKLASVYFGGV